MPTNWTNPVTATDVANANNTFANYIITTNPFVLSWIDQQLDNPVAIQTFFTGAASSITAPIVQLPSTADASIGSSFYINNFLGSNFDLSTNVYTQAPTIQVQDSAGNNLTTLTIIQTVLCTVQAQNGNSSDWLITPLTTPATLATNLTSYVNNTSGIGLNANGYLCQRANIVPITLTDDSGPYVINQLNGNDLYVIVDTSGCITTTPTMILPANSDTENQDGMVATFKNISQQDVVIQTTTVDAAPYYFIDRDITGLSNATPPPYGNSSLTISINGSVSLCYMGLVSDNVPTPCYLFVAVCATRNALAGQSFYYDLTGAPADIVITDLPILYSSLIEFGQGAAQTYNITLQAAGPKLYFVAWNSNNDPDTIIKINSINGIANGQAILTADSPLQSFYIDVQGNLIVTNFTAADITFAVVTNFNFPDGIGSTLEAVNANIFVYIMTTYANTTWSYPYYILNNILPTLQGLVYKGDNPVGDGVGSPQAGQWWVVSVGGQIVYDAVTYNVVPGDKILFLDNGTGLTLNIVNPVRYGLATIATPSSLVIDGTDIGNNLVVSAPLTISFPDPTTLALPTLPEGATQLATKTLITIPPSLFGMVELNFTNHGDLAAYQMWGWSSQIYVSTDGTSWFVEWEASSEASTPGVTLVSGTLDYNLFGGTVVVLSGMTVILPAAPSATYVTAYITQPIILVASSGTFTLQGPGGSTLIGAGFKVIVSAGGWYVEPLTRLT